MRLHRKSFAILWAVAVIGAAQVAPVTLIPPASPEKTLDADRLHPALALARTIETNGLTDKAVQAAVNKEYFPNQFTVVPRDGDKVTAVGTELTLRAVDTKLYNVTLYLSPTHWANPLPTFCSRP